jgi:ABC-2 type transport system permease protein
LYPLLILALTYNVLSAEKEQGTLVLALSQPISLRTFILGKIAVRFGVFLAGTVLLCGSAIAVAGIDIGAPGAPPRIGLWLAAVACYGLFWFAVATVTAAAGKPSSTNAIVLAGAWLVLVVFLPSMLNLIATTAYPVPSRVEMIQAMRVASDRANEQGSVLLAKYYEDHPELASGDAEQAMNDFNMVRLVVGAEVDRQVAPVLDRYRVQLERQQQLVTLARFVSPAILMQDALNDVSGTGTPRHRAFVSQVGAYHQRWRDYFAELIVNRRRLRDFAESPRFVWVEERLADVAQRVTLCLAGLVLPAGLLAGIGLARLRRYPVVG